MKHFCPHCNNIVSLRTYRLHKSLHYDATKKVWRKIKVHKVQDTLHDTQDTFQCEHEEVPELDEHNPLIEDSTGHETKDSQFEIDHSEDTDLDIKTVNDELETLDNADESRITSTLHNVIKWCLYFFVTWITVFNISERAAESMLHFIHRLAQFARDNIPYFPINPTQIPQTMYTVYKRLELLGTSCCITYTVCPLCHQLYDKQDMISKQNCDNVKYANHPHACKRTPCGAALGKLVTVNLKETKFFSFKQFYTQSIVTKLQEYLMRPGFLDNCLKWKLRSTFSETGFYRDVYDGKIWRDFQTVNGTDFLASGKNFALMMNLDWFQPYKHSQYSVGVIYISILNLPRHLRFKAENVILAGIIPGPREPNADGLAFYMRPIVDELLLLWEGVHLNINNLQTTVKAALLCVAADIPAARKLCGFLGHAAKLGCSKCTKEFKTGAFGEKINYGGFEHERPRTGDGHRELIKESVAKTSDSTRNAFNKTHGIRYSELIRLPYVDLVRMTVVDPMHNLFLGTAKHMFSDVWQIAHNLHEKGKLENMERILSAANVPAEFGRIPNHIRQNFNSFTADQWKNWCLYFSLPCLKTHLPEGAYNLWILFVEACRCVCKPVISSRDLAKSHELFIQFGKGVERMYGSCSVTPNMHMHTHLVECIVDFGPIYSFWLFAFERFNGILGSYHRNNKNIEQQMFKRFELVQKIKSVKTPTNFMPNFASYIEKIVCDDVGSLGRTINKARQESEVTSWHDIMHLAEPSISLLSCHGIELKGSGKTELLDEPHLSFLRECLIHIGLANITIPGSYKQYSEMYYLGERYGSISSRKTYDHNIFASWSDLDGKIDMQRDITPGRIHFFIKFFLTSMNGSGQLDKMEIIMAFVEWLKPHCLRKHFGTNSVSVWTNPDVCSVGFGPASFLPVRRITGKYMHSAMKIRNENVYVITKINDKVVW